MQIRNNYQIEWEVLGHYNLPLDKGVGVFNGDMGVVREINHFAEQLVVEFDEGRRVTYGFAHPPQWPHTAWHGSLLYKEYFC